MFVERGFNLPRVLLVRSPILSEKGGILMDAQLGPALHAFWGFRLGSLGLFSKRFAHWAFSSALRTVMSKGVSEAPSL